MKRRRRKREPKRHHRDNRRNTKPTHHDGDVSFEQYQPPDATSPGLRVWPKVRNYPVATSASSAGLKKEGEDKTVVTTLFTIEYANLSRGLYSGRAIVLALGGSAARLLTDYKPELNDALRLQFPQQTFLGEVTSKKKSDRGWTIDVFLRQSLSLKQVALCKEIFSEVSTSRRV